MRRRDLLHLAGHHLNHGAAAFEHIGLGHASFEGALCLVEHSQQPKNNKGKQCGGDQDLYQGEPAAVLDSASYSCHGPVRSFGIGY
ncbi:hypothetical protein SDC9_187003 [bioreactor metagenome]|uniref:Uncharacterized protein n=1 Tax=bioreactor metagenome TaxID=1076179 RepID=A0A645HKD1_9ZZZZ